MRELLGPIEKGFDEALAEARGDAGVIERLRVRFLGRKGEITTLMKQLRTLSADERPAAGKAVWGMLGLWIACLLFIDDS